jgi:hypothetical protein
MYPIILRSRSGLPGYNLPQNLLTNPGTVFEDFETLGQWTAAGTGSIAANTTPGEFRTGTQSIKISAPDNGIESATKTINWVSGGAAPNRLRVYYYCHNAAPLNVTYLRVYLSDNTNIGSIYFKAESKPNHPAKLECLGYLSCNVDHDRCCQLGHHDPSQNWSLFDCWCHSYYFYG